jgi:TldD protein
MLRSIRWVTFAFFLLVPAGFQAQNTKSVVLEALRAEMARSLEHFKKMPNPPYFLSYEVVETEPGSASGSYGARAGSSPVTRDRMLGIDLRVGSYALDNTYPVRGALPNLPDTFNSYQLPVDDDPDAIRALVWYYTDQKYKRAVEQFIAVKTNVQVKAPETDKSGDFSPAKADTYSEPAAPPLNFDRKVWEERVRKYTAPFQRFGNIYSARAQITAQRETRWFVSSDGTSIQTADTAYRLMISAFAKASDGMELPLYESYFSSTIGGLPSDAEVLQKVDQMTKSLMSLKLAPVMTPYVGRRSCHRVLPA